MTDITVLIASAFVELAFEAVVDCFALDVEMRNGVDLEQFWEMWRVNAIAFMGVSVTDSLSAVVLNVWAFKVIPSEYSFFSPILVVSLAHATHTQRFALSSFSSPVAVLFCTSAEDPCSCNGGGFEIVAPFCNFTTEENNVSSKTKQESARSEFVGVFDALGDNTAVVIISVGVGVVILAVFAVARIVIALTRELIFVLC